MRKRNQGIRIAAQTAGVRLWQVAEVLGLRDSELSRKLRHELPEKEKEKVLAAIERLSAENAAEQEGMDGM